MPTLCGGISAERLVSYYICGGAERRGEPFVHPEIAMPLDSMEGVPRSASGIGSHPDILFLDDWADFCFVEPRSHIGCRTFASKTAGILKSGSLQADSSSISCLVQKGLLSTFLMTLPVPLRLPVGLGDTERVGEERVLEGGVMEGRWRVSRLRRTGLEGD